MQALAAALGIRTPSLYAHVSGIEEVRRLLALDGLERLERSAARVTIGRSGPEAARALLQGYRTVWTQNPGLFAATLAIPGNADATWRAAVERLGETCRAALQGYGLSAEDSLHALRMLRSLAHGFVSLELAGAILDPASLDQSFDWMIEAFLAGLAAMADRSRTGDPA